VTFRALLGRDAHWHTWKVFDSTGRMRRSGWTRGRLEAAKEAARDIAELTKLEQAHERTQIDADQMEVMNEV
jgi:hypothetical protein